MPIEDNPFINLLVCGVPILVLYGTAALLGTFHRAWFLKKWRALDRQMRTSLLDRDLSVALGGWVILILFFATAIVQVGMFSGAALLFIGAGLVLIAGSIILSSLSLYFRTR